MFTDASSEPVGFRSQLCSNKPEKSSNIQTDEVVYKENETQAIETKDVHTQTIIEQRKKPQVDYQKLAAFLKRVTPGILEDLDEAYGSNAFENYDPGASGEPSTTVKLLAKLNTLEESNNEIKISDITWSSGGGTLSVSHSVVYHETYCDHLSKIKFYDLTKDYQLPIEPKKVLNLNSCVTSLSYHPTEPSIIAAGLFNGDIVLWNLRDETAVTPTQVCTHGDTVSLIHWRPRSINDVSLLVTASRDGYILVHKLTANFTTITQHKRFKIAKEHNPSESTRPRSAGGSRERATEAGLSVTTFDFSTKDPMLFVVGTLCGGLYKCSVDRATPVEGNENILDPVVDEYERHEGSVTCVRSSPTRNLFVTSGTDKEIRIYDFAESVIHQTISVDDTIVGLTWLPGIIDVFTAYGAGASIHFYNVTNGKPVTNLKLEMSEKQGTSCLQFNGKRDLVAIGDTKGNLEIWKIPRQPFT
ncbi:WD repeat-containing protein 34 isoform X2 [Cephus cinctus]|uniref:WD repeat-containing protein 34 isoform X2 n=1 Tax=Cephus cinctus TaxID=211228 RepID=A0AAJ7C7B1_CEPCN|nr:WD repeat-containing protein 34 isoform X2 [Cephus cinctus]